MRVIVDTREPPQYSKFIRKAYPKLIVEEEALPAGDYMSGKCLYERKTWIDLYGSLIGSKTKPGRLWNQCNKLSTYSDDYQVGFLVTGNIINTANECASHGVPFDTELMLSTVSEIASRYNFGLFIFDDEWQAILFMIKYMKRCDENKCGVPKKRDEDILWARLLQVTVSQYKDLKMNFGNINNIISAEPKHLQMIRGIGPAKAKHINGILNRRL